MNSNIFDTFLKISLSLSPVFIVFIYYYKNFVFKRSKIISLSAFFWGILSCNATLLLQSLLPQTNNALLKAFFYAGFAEELIRYLFIVFLIHKSSSHFTITEGVFQAILVGLGFAVAENMHYSVNYNGNTIFLRIFSSVPIHVFLSGIMGYFASYAYLNSSRHISKEIPTNIRVRRVLLLLLALGYPVLIHGFYDWCLLARSKAVYIIPLIIVFIFIQLEYLLDIGRDIFGKNILNMLKITADDVRIILHQQNYENWVNNRQKKKKIVRLFHDGWKKTPLLLALFFIIISAVSYYFIETRPELLTLFKDLNKESKTALLSLYPLTVGIIILISIKINFSFFRIFISHVPQTSLINIHPPDDEEDVYSFVMDIHPVGVFLPVENHWPKNGNLIIDFVKIDKKGKEKFFRTQATILWSNQFNKTMPLGYVCHFKKTSLRFRWFRLIYQLSKLVKVPNTYRKLNEE